jgi:hypothetical protein
VGRGLTGLGPSQEPEKPGHPIGGEDEMNWKAFAATSCLGLMTIVPSAMADQWNKKTILTVNESIQVPGKVLQPGK